MFTALPVIALYQYMKFQQSSSISIGVMLRTKSKDLKRQRAITPFKIHAELWFLCTALPLIKVYLHMKFHQPSYISIGSYAPDKIKRPNISKWNNSFHTAARIPRKRINTPTIFSSFVFKEKFELLI